MTLRIVLAVLVGCGAPEGPRPVTPAPVAPVEQAAPPDASVPADASIPADTVVPAVAPAATDATSEVWLKGSIHVHAKPSGDSIEPIGDVIEWYAARGYDFIALTDHNRVSEVDASTTAGQVAVRAADKGLIVLSGVELTHNPRGCQPPGDDSGKCRIHVNALGVTARPDGKLEWAERKSNQRVDMYQAALDAARKLGAAVVQVNHPNYYWGMTPDVLAEIGKRGAQLVEIANVQFSTWNAGDAQHLSTEALWDAVLARGITMWGVASDDAHDYDEGGGKYPPGGGWVVVKATRDPKAILDALAAGRFYSSTGVVLARAEVFGEELVVEVSPTGLNQHTVTFIENGTIVGTARELTAKRTLPATGYVRAVVTRDDGKKAWVQPARR